MARGGEQGVSRPRLHVGTMHARTHPWIQSASTAIHKPHWLGFQKLGLSTTPLMGIKEYTERGISQFSVDSRNPSWCMEKLH